MSGGGPAEEQAGGFCAVLSKTHKVPDMDLQRKEKKIAVGGKVVTCRRRLRRTYTHECKKKKNYNVAHGSADLHFFFFPLLNRNSRALGEESGSIQRLTFL